MVMQTDLQDFFSVSVGSEVVGSTKTVGRGVLSDLFGGG